jgi:flavorubredoxin
MPSDVSQRSLVDVKRGMEGEAMSAVVVYESWFGNTRKIAEAIADGLREEGLDVALVSVDEPLPELETVELLVVGAPTHVHGLSSRGSRQGAIEQGAERDAPGIGVRGWLKELPSDLAGQAAAFDTRLHKPVLLVGSAARKIARRLERHGFELLVPPESFFVTSGDGTPLEEGELERARGWARTVAARTKVAAGAAVA